MITAKDMKILTFKSGGNWKDWQNGQEKEIDQEIKSAAKAGKYSCSHLFTIKNGEINGVETLKTFIFYCKFFMANYEMNGFRYRLAFKKERVNEKRFDVVFEIFWSK